MQKPASLYERLGRCMELAQQMEYFVATALMAADGLRSGSHTDVRDAEYLKLVSKLDRLTLGQALTGLKERVPKLEGLQSSLDIALDARNRLAHQILAERSIAEMNPTQLEEFASDLQNIELDLRAGYRAAFAIAKTLVNERVSRRVAHDFQVPPANAA